MIAGDDHGCVSSGMRFQSDLAIRVWCMPVLHPANIAELIAFGNCGWARFRCSEPGSA